MRYQFTLPALLWMVTFVAAATASATWIGPGGLPRVVASFITATVLVWVISPTEPIAGVMAIFCAGIVAAFWRTPPSYELPPVVALGAIIGACAWLFAIAAAQSTHGHVASKARSQPLLAIGLLAIVAGPIMTLLVLPFVVYWGVDTAAEIGEDALMLGMIGALGGALVGIPYLIAWRLVRSSARVG